MKHSPAYAQAYALHGANMPVGLAIKFAGAHGFTLEELREAGDTPLEKTNGLVKTLELFQALGY